MDKISLLRFCVLVRGSFEIEVAGNSMSPSLTSGDIALLSNDREIRPGDIAVYPGKRSGLPVAHRVVKIDTLSGNKDIYLIGDNCAKVDICKSDDVVGHICAIRQQEDARWHDLSQTPFSLSIVTLSILLTREKDTNQAEVIERQRRAVCEKWRAQLFADH